MRRIGILALLGAVVGLGLVAAGCSSKKTSKTDEGAAKKTGEHGKHEHSGKVKENLAKLSDDDRASAEKQEMCPVTGEHLGSMGVPKKVTVKGQQVWICCDGCKDTIEKDPDKYLAKLKK